MRRNMYLIYTEEYAVFLYIWLLYTMYVAFIIQFNSSLFV